MRGPDPSATPASSISRRRFLTATATSVAAATAVGACTGHGAGGGAGTDLDAAAKAASIERVAFDAYVTIRDLITRGRLGAALPGAIVAFVIAAADQHHKAMEGWNAILTAGGRPADDAPHVELKTKVDLAMATLTDVITVARLSLQLEDYASRTYLAMIPTLKNPDSVRLAGQILVVDQAHQAVLRYVIGMYPVGSGVDERVQPSDVSFAPADPQADRVTG
ncbi:MAG TPA: ferritin-like domain-containing protein [Acidimicrobiales bacterium]|nr:ferritin-like domain-containing protein [Acidimicrobiales bacterium]